MILLTTRLSAVVVAALALVSDAGAEVSLAPVFSSNMVLQRDVPAKISGWADAGEAVVVKLGNQVVGNAVGAGLERPWAVTLPALKAGTIPDITVEGKNTITLTNLLAGDVWVCSGQSNMEMSLQSGPWCKYGGALNADQEVAAANHPRLRLFVSASKNPWVECSPETAKSFSATGYFFGRELQRQLDVPIGLVMASVGGTPAEYWTPKAAREAWAGYGAAMASAKKVLAELRPQFDADRKAMTDWPKAVAEAKASGQPVPARPVAKLTKEQEEQVRAAIHAETVGTGYAARIKPLTAMTIKGAIWYQGEGNAERSSEYVELLTQLIGGWRKDWEQGDFPFLIMQLVNFGSGDGTWPALRAAQQAVAETVPNTGLAVGIDIGDPKNIHPANKQEAGRRLALLALKQVYGRELVACGPKMKSARFEGGQVKVSFDTGGKDQKLVLKGAEPNGFEIAGADGKFFSAVATLGDREVWFAASSVPNPKAVRYAWAGNPPASLFNSAGLPSAPFQKTAGEEQ
jgi:sialate O-acetylesterase